MRASVESRPPESPRTAFLALMCFKRLIRPTDCMLSISVHLLSRDDFDEGTKGNLENLRVSFVSTGCIENLLIVYPLLV